MINPYILYFDPWYLEYSSNMYAEMAKHCNVTVVTHCSVSIGSAPINIQPLFFRYSDQMKRCLARQTLRSCEYIAAWMNTLHLLSTNSYDVFHTQWLLMYPIDLYCLARIRKCSLNRNIKIVHTAHNSLPHVNGRKYTSQMTRIYNMVDKIIVHGNAIKDQIGVFAPEVIGKIYIQRHGLFGVQTDINVVDYDHVDKKWKVKVNQCTGLILLYLGGIYYNKGVDRLLDYWLKNPNVTKDHLLVIVGQVSERSSQFSLLERLIRSYENVIYCPRRVSQSEHDYLYTACDIVLMPYRNASMSGVVFSAAKFHKTVFTTKVGCIPEYVVDKQNAIVVENSYLSIQQGLNSVLGCSNRTELAKMGRCLHDYVHTTFSWSDICRRLVDQVYK